MPMSCDLGSPQKRVVVNGKPLETRADSLYALREEVMPEADILIYNGFAVGSDLPLKEEDSIHLIKRGHMPSEDELESLMASRHTPHVHRAMKAAKVGIAGCGGLGSHIAVALARMGVGRLVVVDFDVVEPSNLNRQAYGIKHLGMPKVNALKEVIADINPYVVVESHYERVTEVNALSYFGDCDLVLEAFDVPQNKAMLVETLLKDGKMPLVAASGLAGTHSSNSIVTNKIMNRLYMVGDGVNGAGPFEGLMAPRVLIAAGHQANMAVRLLLGEKDC